jgi:predicted phosphodiesterase
MKNINDYIKGVWASHQTQGKEIPSRIQIAADILKKFKTGITPHAVGLRENKLGLKREWKAPDVPGISAPIKRLASGVHLKGIKATPKSHITKGGKLQKILFIPDCHFPYQDELAFSLMMEAAKDFKPDHVIILGDFIDMYSVSAHDKNPKRAMKLEEEITASVDALWRVKGLGAKNNVYVSGNHEDRLTRYLMQKAPELWDRINVPTVLALDKLGFEYVPYKSHYKLGKLFVTHDTGKAGYNAHKQALDAFHRSVVIGHTHRMGYVIQGDADGDKHVGAMFGWLGDVKQVDYMHNINAVKDWTLGFGIGYLDPVTGYVYLTPVPIVNYSCVVEGKMYKS